MTAFNTEGEMQVKAKTAGKKADGAVKLAIDGGSKVWDTGFPM